MSNSSNNTLDNQILSLLGKKSDDDNDGKTPTWAFKALSLMANSKKVTNSYNRKHKPTISTEHGSLLYKKKDVTIYKNNITLFQIFVKALKKSKTLPRKRARNINKINLNSAKYIASFFSNNLLSLFSTYILNNLTSEQLVVFKDNANTTLHQVNDLYLLQYLSNVTGNGSINGITFFQSSFESILRVRESVNIFLFSYNGFCDVPSICYDIRKEVLWDKLHSVKISNTAGTFMFRKSSFGSKPVLSTIIDSFVSIKTPSSLMNFNLLKMIISSFKFISKKVTNKKYQLQLLHFLSILFRYTVLYNSKRHFSSSLIYTTEVNDILDVYFNVSSDARMDAYTNTIERQKYLTSTDISPNSLDTLFQKLKIYPDSTNKSLIDYFSIGNGITYYYLLPDNNNLKLNRIKNQLLLLKEVCQRSISIEKSMNLDFKKLRKWYLKLKDFNNYLKQSYVSLFKNYTDENIKSNLISLNINVSNLYKLSFTFLDDEQHFDYRLSRVLNKVIVGVSKVKYDSRDESVVECLDNVDKRFFYKLCLMNKQKLHYFKTRYNDLSNSISDSKIKAHSKFTETHILKIEMVNLLKQKQVMIKNKRYSFFYSVFLINNQLINVFRNHLIKKGFKERATNWTLIILQSIKRYFKVCPIRFLSSLLLRHYQTNLFKEIILHKKTKKQSQKSIIVPKRLSVKKQFFYMVFSFLKESVLFNHFLKRKYAYNESFEHKTRLLSSISNYVLYLVDIDSQTDFLSKKNKFLEEKIYAYRQYKKIKVKKQSFFKKKYTSYKGHLSVF